MNEKDRRRESGEPGGGQGRRDEVGGSGVYPASAQNAPDDAELRSPAEWGQGERGAAGYDDSGRSELSIGEEQLRAAENAETVNLNVDRTEPGQAGSRTEPEQEEER